MNAIPVVTIIGVPNTGKSTLFNRILGKRKALVHNLPGMTRDIFRQKVRLHGGWVDLQDSGGFFPDKEIISAEINKKIFQAAENSDLIIFLFDGKRELLGYEKDLYLEIRKLHKKIIPVLNKADRMDGYLPPLSYYELKADFIPISAEHNLGVENLLEEIDRSLEKTPKGAFAVESATRISIIGKPNVGKSSLINKIVNDDLVIVSPLPGTTRDSVDLEVRRNRQAFILVDNAGIRKMQKIKENTESAAVIRAENELRQSDIIIFVIDISKRVDQNDLLIAQKVAKAAKPVIIAGNKADLLAPGTASNKFFAQARNRFHDLYFAPFVPVSALSGKNVFQMLDLAESINAKLEKKIQLSHFNELVKRVLREKKLTTADHRIFSPKYISVESQRPFFVKFHCKTNLKLNASDEMFLKKRLNQELQFEGIPIYFKISASR
ncbi:MAG: ribosome biogenesis GTPase Der [Acidobacteria bacterium]|jgi:GTP-binding protein|nr:ribosome biogenesis GTPase Der [Acidobacteriota bacterium]